MKQTTDVVGTCWNDFLDGKAIEGQKTGRTLKHGRYVKGRGVERKHFSSAIQRYRRNGREQGIDERTMEKLDIETIWKSGYRLTQLGGGTLQNLPAQLWELIY